MRREIGGAEEDVVLGCERAVVLTVDKEQVDAIGGRRLGEDGAELHEQGGPQCAIVRPRDGLAPLGRVGRLVGDRPRVPVRHIQHAIRLRGAIPSEYVAKGELFAPDGRMRPALDNHGVRALRHRRDDPVAAAKRAISARNARSEVELGADERERGTTVERRVRRTVTARTEHCDRAKEDAQSS